MAMPTSAVVMESRAIQYVTYVIDKDGQVRHTMTMMTGLSGNNNKTAAAWSIPLCQYIDATFTRCGLYHRGLRPRVTTRCGRSVYATQLKWRTQRLKDNRVAAITFAAHSALLLPLFCTIDSLISYNNIKLVGLYSLYSLYLTCTGYRA